MSEENEAFETMAAEFYVESGGMLAPGKDQPGAVWRTEEERRAAWDVFVRMRCHLVAMTARAEKAEACLVDIADLCVDYDGYDHAPSLKGLIDEIKALARTKNPMPVKNMVNDEASAAAKGYKP